MDLPYICDHQVGYSAGGYSLSPMWFLTCYIYPCFQDYLHWWVVIFHEIYDHWSVAVLTVTEHFIFSHFSFFFKLFAFCTEFNLYTPICFVLFMIMDLPFICDRQVSYSAGGYSLSPKGFLTWNIYPFSQDSLHWWVLILHQTFDHWSAAVLTVTEHFIYSHFSFFFKLVAFCTEFNLFTPFLLFLLR